MKQKLLRVDAPHFCAGAIWQKDGETWRCTNTVAPIIAWMRGKTAGEVGDYLKRKGWAFSWLDIPDLTGDDPREALYDNSKTCG